MVLVLLSVRTISVSLTSSDSSSPYLPREVPHGSILGPAFLTLSASTVFRKIWDLLSQLC